MYAKGHHTKAIFLQPSAKISPLAAKSAGLKLAMYLFLYGLTNLAAHSDTFAVLYLSISVKAGLTDIITQQCRNSVASGRIWDISKLSRWLHRGDIRSLRMSFSQTAHCDNVVRTRRHVFQ